MMENPTQITFRKIGKKGGRIIVNFNTNDMPDFLWIKGTDDLARVKKQKKQWVSRYKYNSLGISLLSLDDKFGIEENLYSNDGKLIVVSSSSPNATTLSNYVFELNAMTVNFKWTTSEETNLIKFHVLKQTGPDVNADYSEVTTVAALGVGKNYSVLVPFDSTGTFGIQLITEYTDGNTLLTLFDFVDIS